MAANTGSTQTFAEATGLWDRAVGATNYMLDHWWAWLVLGFALWLFLKARYQHQLLGELDERCMAAAGDIDAVLNERHALIGNLAETVKGFAGQEHKVLKDVIDARARATSTTGGAKMDAEAAVSSSLANLWSITETYPQLASSSHFAELRAELVRMEDRINAARRFYNLTVEELNGVRRAFPYNLLDSIAKTATHEKYSLGENRAQFDQPVKVSF